MTLLTILRNVSAGGPVTLNLAASNLVFTGTGVVRVRTPVTLAASNLVFTADGTVRAKTFVTLAASPLVFGGTLNPRVKMLLGSLVSNLLFSTSGVVKSRPQISGSSPFVFTGSAVITVPTGGGSSSTTRLPLTGAGK